MPVLNVLIALHVPWLRQYLARMLRNRGHDVVVAECNHEALNWLTIFNNCQKPLHLIILGSELAAADAEKLAEHVPRDGAAPTVLLLVGHEGPEWAKLFEDCARVELVCGPPDTAAILARVDELSQANEESS